ncbi:MAG: BrnA antitoxin family protein [bacterium]|nr:BrnA antitoxin family protein [bacterium]
MKKDYDFSKGRRGPLLTQTGKTRITIYIDDDVLEEFRERGDASGQGYQTMVNQALRDYLSKSRPPVDARTLRRILREELKRAGLCP